MRLATLAEADSETLQAALERPASLKHHHRRQYHHHHFHLYYCEHQDWIFCAVKSNQVTLLLVFISFPCCAKTVNISIILSTIN